MGQALPILAGAPNDLDREIFEAAFRSSPEGMAVAEGGVICSANQAFSKLVGSSSPESLEGQRLSRFRPAGHSCEFEHSEPDQAGRKQHLCQFVSKRHDGTPLKIESTCASFRVGNREFQLITARDVTVRERRRMVRDGHRRFRVIFHAAHMGIIQCDLQGFVLESNPAVERMLGYSRAELRGMNLHDFTHPEGPEGAARLFRELVEMRYLWATPIHIDNERLKDVLGAEPHTPLDLAVRETLIGIGCVPKEPLRQAIGSDSLAVSAW